MLLAADMAELQERLQAVLDKYAPMYKKADPDVDPKKIEQVTEEVRDAGRVGTTTGSPLSLKMQHENETQMGDRYQS